MLFIPLSLSLSLYFQEYSLVAIEIVLKENYHFSYYEFYMVSIVRDKRSSLLQRSNNEDKESFMKANVKMPSIMVKMPQLSSLICYK